MIKNLKQLRQNKGISQKALADIISVSQQSINKYENHNIEPDIETLMKLADYFNTSIDYLVGYSNTNHKIEKVSFYHLNDEESDLIKKYRTITPAEKQSIKLVIDNYIK